MISHRARLEKCLAHAELDRVPVAFWRHFPVDDQTPEGLARATLEFQHAFDLDFVKVTPSSSYCLKDWGAKDDWRGATEGTRDYTYHPIAAPEDWEKLRVLDPTKGYLGSQLECLAYIVRELGPETPALQTIFNPLSQAKNLAGGQRLLVHLRSYPAAVYAGLKTITETTRLFVEAVAKTGVAGIFFAVQHAQFNLLSEAEFQAFGKEFDFQVLEPTRQFWLNMLHLHGNDVMFSMAADYPVQIINWHDRETYPSLQEGLKLFSGVLCGGLSREETLVFGSPDQVKAQAQEAFQQTGGKRFILGTGCVVPIIAPYGNLLAARQAFGY